MVFQFLNVDPGSSNPFAVTMVLVLAVWLAVEPVVAPFPS